MDSLYLFAQNVLAHHLSAVGGILTLLSIGELVTSKKFVLPPKWTLWAGLVLLFIACCQAWFDEHHNAQQLIAEKASLSGQIAQLQAQVAFKDKPITLQMPSASEHAHVNKPTRPTIQQDSKGDKSPNIVGNGNTVNPPINPNRQTTTYSCEGNKQTVGPDKNGVFTVEGGDPKPKEDFNAMALLVNTQQYPALIEKCESLMKSEPKWLTPYLMCAVGYLGVGQHDKAQEMLSYVTDHSGPTYEQGECKKISDYVKAKL